MKLWTEGSQIQVSILTKLANTVNNRNAGLIGVNFNDKRQKDTYKDLREFIDTYQKKIDKVLYNQNRYVLSKKSPNSIFNFKARRIDKKKINPDAGQIIDNAKNWKDSLKVDTNFLNSSGKSNSDNDKDKNVKSVSFFPPGTLSKLKAKEYERTIRKIDLIEILIFLRSLFLCDLLSN